MTKKCAVIQFPGSNCEYETVKSLEAASINTDLIRWNCSEAEFSDYDAYVLPGGFSFQDRVRAGVVASKLPIMSYLKRAAAEGKAILGICNGCQILAETGLVPDTQNEAKIEMALAPNMRDSKAHGFMCDWVYVKIKHPENNIFTKAFEEDDVLPIQINHGEGNFKFSESISTTFNDTTQLNYVTEDGSFISSYPVNPNGTTNNIAGLSNANGNVLAMMPHPERASFLTQVPSYIDHSWADLKRSKPLTRDIPGPWAPLFLSLKQWLEG